MPLSDNQNHRNFPVAAASGSECNPGLNNFDTFRETAQSELAKRLSDAYTAITQK